MRLCLLWLWEEEYQLLWEVMQSVVGGGMQQGISRLRSQGVGVEFVDVASLKTVDFEEYCQAVVGNVNFLDDRFRVIHFGAAIGRLEDVAVGFHRPGFWIAGKFCVDGFCECQLETIRLRSHFADFKRDLASPAKTFQRKGFCAA